MKKVVFMEGNALKVFRKDFYYACMVIIIIQSIIILLFTY